MSSVNLISPLFIVPLLAVKFAPFERALGVFDENGRLFVNGVLLSKFSYWFFFIIDFGLSILIEL